MEASEEEKAMTFRAPKHVRPDIRKLWNAVQRCGEGRLEFRPQSRWDWGRIEASFEPPDAARIVRRGHCKDGSLAKLKKSIIDRESSRLIYFQPRRCHDNAVLLAKLRKSLQFCTGFAMGPDDDVWRPHSWAERKDGSIIETVSVREKYFGACYQGKERDSFAERYDISWEDL